MRKIIILSVLFTFNVHVKMIFSQVFSVTEMAEMPEPVSNNGVTMANVGGVPHLFSFAGIDNTKLYSGIHLKSFRYNTQTDVWEQIEEIPDNTGKIAVGVSTVKNKIYIIGGYHVAANGNETSSSKVHRYDPETNTFLGDGAQSILPIDDHVQAVWRDSLIYVITGWSNTGNVPNVQLYNPSTNSWTAGTSVPNNNIYKAFGASGMIIGDTIYYQGGASMGMNFPAQNTLRKGVIDPQNPFNITWTQPVTIVPLYRGAATTDGNSGLYFLGGSAVTYNYNGIAYNGTGGVMPNASSTYLSVNNLSSWYAETVDLPMDLRGIGELSNTVKYLAGGMTVGQQVSNKTLKIELAPELSVSNKVEHPNLRVYPNPFSSKLHFESNLSIKKITIHDIFGKSVYVNSMLPTELELKNLNNGNYFLTIESDSEIFQKLLIKADHE